MNQEVIDFIRSQIRSGQPIASIRGMLATQGGWSDDEIDKAMVAANMQTPPSFAVQAAESAQGEQPSANQPNTAPAVSDQGITVEYAHAETNDFINRVFAWMSVGLVVTGIVGYVVSANEALSHMVVGNILIFFGLIVLEFLAVMFLARMSAHMNSTEAAILFLLYAFMNGLTFSVIFLVYRISSIGEVFVVTAGTFIVVSIYGFVTKRDLTTVGHLCFMGLVGLIIASLANLFWWNNTTSLVIAYVGVVVFVGLIAFDTQKIKGLNQIVKIGSETEKKEAIQGALILYLDFVNLFLNLLRIMGKRK